MVENYSGVEFYEIFFFSVIANTNTTNANYLFLTINPSEMKKLNLLMTAGFMAIASMTFAQDALTDNHTVTVGVPEVAILDIEPDASKNIALTFTAPTEAGEALTAPAVNSTLWLNYSSIVASGAVKRTITAEIDAAITGIDLKVTAAAPANGVGDVGTAGAQITLSTTAQTVLTAIGSCYTTDGASNGSNLTYEVALPVVTTNYNAIFISSTAVTVTYTITDDV